MHNRVWKHKVPLAKAANLCGVLKSVLSCWATRGRFKSAEKAGHNWIVDPAEAVSLAAEYKARKVAPRKGGPANVCRAGTEPAAAGAAFDRCTLTGECDGLIPPHDAELLAARRAKLRALVGGAA